MLTVILWTLALAAAWVLFGNLFVYAVAFAAGRLGLELWRALGVFDALTSMWLPRWVNRSLAAAFVVGTVIWPLQLVALAVAWRSMREESKAAPVDEPDMWKECAAACEREFEDELEGMHIAWRNEAGGSVVVPLRDWSDEQLEDVATDLSGFLGELHDELARRELSA